MEFDARIGCLILALIKVEKVKVQVHLSNEKNVSVILLLSLLD